MDFYVLFLFIIFNCFWIVVAQQRGNSKRMNHVRLWLDSVGETKTKRLPRNECKSKAHTTIAKQINQSATVYTSVIARRELIATWLEYGVWLHLSHHIEQFIWRFFPFLSPCISISLFYFSLKFLNTKEKIARISAENSYGTEP